MHLSALSSLLGVFHKELSTAWVHKKSLLANPKSDCSSIECSWGRYIFEAGRREPNPKSWLLQMRSRHPISEQHRIQRPCRGAKKHEIYVATCGGHLFLWLICTGLGGGGHGPLGTPWIRYWVNTLSVVGGGSGKWRSVTYDRLYESKGGGHSGWCASLIMDNVCLWGGGGVELCAWALGKGGDFWWVMWEIDKVKDGERTVWVIWGDGWRTFQADDHYV